MVIMETIAAYGAFCGLIIPVMRATPLIPSFASSEGLEGDQKIVDDLTDRMGISKKIEVRRTPVEEKFEYAAFGALALPFSQSFLVPQTHWISQEAKPLVYAHEIAHIECNHLLKFGALLAITIIAVSIIFFGMSPLEFALLAGVVAGVAALILYSQYAEKEADLRACEVLSDEEILSGVAMFEQIRIEQLETYNEAKAGRTGHYFADLVFRMTLNENGDNLLDIFHPPLSERISYMNAFVKDRATV